MIFGFSCREWLVLTVWFPDIVDPEVADSEVDDPEVIDPKSSSGFSIQKLNQAGLSYYYCKRIMINDFDNDQKWLERLGRFQKGWE